MKKKIYVCGNSLVENDSMPIRILHDLRGLLPEIEFVMYDPTENFPEGDPVYFLDTALDIREVLVMDDPSKLLDSPRNSVHDSDLAFQLKMMKKLGELPRIYIFCVPEKGRKDDILRSLKGQIRKIIPT
jgi:Ni,Fe-hydrogenase maturation factor